MKYTPSKTLTLSTAGSCYRCDNLEKQFIFLFFSDLPTCFFSSKIRKPINKKVSPNYSETMTFWESCENPRKGILIPRAG
jgi:hypothetical protein